MAIVFVILSSAAICIALIIVSSYRSAKEKRRIQEEMFWERERTKRLAQEKEAAQKEATERIISSIAKDFSNMEGWNSWDYSVHRVDGQLNRLQRAVQEAGISVVCYDPAYKYAKVRGSSGNYYITGASGCSCWDFKKRALPCKHMYHLAIALRGDVNKEIIDHEHKSLYGLTIVVAGRFQGGRDSIRKTINDLDGLWADDITESASILVCGKAPSKEKVDWFANHRLPILCDGDITSIFSTENQSSGSEAEKEA